MISFDITAEQITLLVGVIVSVGLPLLVGLVTKSVTSSGLKALLLALLSLATGIGTSLYAALESGTEYNILTGLAGGLGAFLIAIGTHYGIYKATGVTEKVQATLVKPKLSTNKESGKATAGNETIPVVVTVDGTPVPATPTDLTPDAPPALETPAS